MSKITPEFRLGALRRGMLVESTRSACNEAEAFAGAIELANLGFIVSPTDLQWVGTDAVEKTIALARQIMGADRDMTPIYPGFPSQVQELSTMTLLMEQILHYWSAGTLLPNYPNVVRQGSPIKDMLRNARPLRVMRSESAAQDIIKELVTSPVAMSDDDKALLNEAVKQFRIKPYLDKVTESIKDARNGENIQSLVRAIMATGNRAGKYQPKGIATKVIPMLSNSDSLLRVMLTLFTTHAPIKSASPTAEKSRVLAYSDDAPVFYRSSSIRSVHWEDAEDAKAKTRIENYTLAVDNLADRHVRSVRMVNIPRPVRRAVIEKLGQTSWNFKADSLASRRMLWRKVMTAVHPYDFDLSDAQKRAVDIIHSNVEYRTLNSLVEVAMENRDVVTAVTLMAENQPGNLLRRLVALMRLVDNEKEAKVLAKAIRKTGAKASLTTLISAYNGVIAANDEAARVTRVAGINNTMVSRADVVKVDVAHVHMVAKALKKAIRNILADKPAPVGVVPVKSSVAVPLVRRDAATTDRQMDRGAEMTIAGKGDTLRVFSHWNNNQRMDGYMDIGLVVLDDNFKELAVLTWNSWADHRDLGTYSGDKNVYPGDDASEYFDLDLAKVRKTYPSAIYVAMTIQSWSGWPISQVDIIAGAMLRSKPDSGEVFDARTVVTAFKPTTDATQSVPLAVDLRSGKMLWVDSSNGSTDSGVSSTGDNSIGPIIYDELARVRFTLGDLATLWATAHGVETVKKPVDRDALLKLL